MGAFPEMERIHRSRGVPDIVRRECTLRRHKPNPALECTIGGRSTFNVYKNGKKKSIPKQVSTSSVSGHSVKLSPSRKPAVPKRTKNSNGGPRQTNSLAAPSVFRFRYSAEPKKPCLKHTKLADFRPKTRTIVRFTACRVG